MDTPVINLETLNGKITNIVATVDARNKSYMQNFAVIRDQIKELERVINNEVLYYKDRRERPPNSDMYAGGFKSRKTRKSVNKRRKTVKKYN